MKIYRTLSKAKLDTTTILFPKTNGNTYARTLFFWSDVFVDLT
uniref:Uncharacterized protein n=1 Tax=Arundo donax TaxID=35708 RepID=A0A0A9AXJ9_ARUDO